MPQKLQDQDYKYSFFKYPECTQIHGEPTKTTLLTICNEIKANTQTVATILGSGSFSHLGLVYTATVYAAIPDTQQYVQPANPQSLVIAPNTTQYIVVRIYDTHQKIHSFFCEV